MTPRVYLAAYRDGMSTRYQEVGPEDMGAEEWQRVERPDLKPGELLPCPFCGSPAPRYQMAWGIRCTACDASVPCRGDDYGPWNRRATPATLAASPEVAALLAAAILDAQLRCMERGRIDTPNEIRTAAAALRGEKETK